MKVHELLEYEDKQRKRLVTYVPVLNRMAYDLQDNLGKKAVKEMRYMLSFSTYDPALSVYNPSREQMEIIKKVFKADSMKKSITEFGVTFETVLGNGVTLRFKFGLPDTCEVTKEVRWESVPRSKYKVQNDGEIYEKTEVVTGVNCGEESMMKAVFGEDDA